MVFEVVESCLFSDKVRSYSVGYSRLGSYFLGNQQRTARLHKRNTLQGQVYLQPNLPYYKLLLEQFVQNRLGVCGLGKSGSMVIVVVQAVFDVVNLVRTKATMETNRVGGVILVGMGRHRRQVKRCTEMDPLDNGLVDTAVHGLETRLDGVALGVHLVGDLVRRRLQTIDLCR